MHVYAIACALPQPDYYLIFHSHVNPRLAVWTEQDLERYLTLQDMVRQLYETPDHLSDLSPRDRRPLCPPEVDRDTALQRLVPYLVEADRRSKGATYLHAETDSVTTREAVGIGDQAYHLRNLVIVRRAPQFIPTPELLVALEQAGRALEARDRSGEVKALADYRPHMDLFWDGESLDLDENLAFRGDPALVWAVRRHANPARLVHGGVPKVVTLPTRVSVYLSRDKGGEVIKERARYWS